jgi:hypothetical protein
MRLRSTLFWCVISNDFPWGSQLKPGKTLGSDELEVISEAPSGVAKCLCRTQFIENVIESLCVARIQPWNLTLARGYCFTAHISGLLWNHPVLSVDIRWNMSSAAMLHLVRLRACHVICRQPYGRKFHPNMYILVAHYVYVKEII